MGVKVNPSKVFPFKPISVNQQLQSVQSVLTYECKKSPELLGGGVRDYGDIFKMLTSFKEKHRRDRRPLFVVRLDLTRCYDRMNQDKMLEILDKVYFTSTYLRFRPSTACINGILA